MRDNLYELYITFSKIAEEKNKRIRLNYSNLFFEFCSKEIFSLVVSECLLEDVETIFMLKDNGYSNRYADFVIRNMAEQVIEYLYIMKNPELIKEYFGENLSAESDYKNLFNCLKRTGEARFKTRKSGSQMSVRIGEKKSNDEKISLYDIFKLKAEFEHNSYFNHFLDVIPYPEENNDVDDLDYIYMSYILHAFMKVYGEV